MPLLGQVQDCKYNGDYLEQPGDSPATCNHRQFLPPTPSYRAVDTGHWTVMFVTRWQTSHHQLQLIISRDFSLNVVLLGYSRHCMISHKPCTVAPAAGSRCNFCRSSSACWNNQRCFAGDKCVVTVTMRLQA